MVEEETKLQKSVAAIICSLNSNFLMPLLITRFAQSPFRLCNFSFFFFVLGHSLDTTIERCCSFRDLLCESGLLSSNLIGLIHSRLDDLLLLGTQRLSQILVELGLLLLKFCDLLVIRVRM